MLTYWLKEQQNNYVVLMTIMFLAADEIVICQFLEVYIFVVGRQKKHYKGGYENDVMLMWLQFLVEGKICLGMPIKDVRSQGGLSRSEIFRIKRKWGFSDADVRTFWCKKLRTF